LADSANVTIPPLLEDDPVVGEPLPELEQAASASRALVPMTAAPRRAKRGRTRRKVRGEEPFRFAIAYFLSLRAKLAQLAPREG
jgi:hypothetical protein